MNQSRPEARAAAPRPRSKVAEIEERVRKASFIASYPFILNRLSGADIALLRRAGCRQIYLVLGLKQPLIEELSEGALVAQVLALRHAGIEVMATFTLGHDEDPVDVEPLILDFCERSATNLAEFTLRTPFPGTLEFAAMERAGRILTRDWARYNAANVVFQPLHQSPESLQATYLRLWCRFYENVNLLGIQVRSVKGFGREILKRSAGAGGP